MTNKVVLAHEPGEKDLALKLAGPIGAAGYDVHHDGCVLPGESLIAELNKALSHEGPVVLCGTQKAVGSLWVSQVIQAAQARSNMIRVFAVKLEGGANIALLTGPGVVFADCSSNFASGVQDLLAALKKYYPVHKDEEYPVPSNVAAGPFPYLDEILISQHYDPLAMSRFRSQLKPDIIREYPEDLTDEEFLRRAGLMRSQHLTRAGVLLFGLSPQATLPLSVCRCIVYHGSEKSDSREPEDVFGTVPDQILKIYDFIQSRIRKRERIIPGYARAQQEFEYPMITVREIVANALVHRDFEDRKRHAAVRLYSDRIEVLSPGEWIGATALSDGRSLELDRLASESVKRNGQLATVISWVQLFEGEGSGIPKSVTECRGEGIRLPLVRQVDGFCAVTIFPRPNWEAGAPSAAMATFVAGAAVLLVDPRHRLKAEPSSERELLLTELRATTLVGRTAELTSLQDWLNTPHQIAVRCLVGPAGAGKTRLAIELCERAEADGWAAGFARHAELARFHANHSPSEWQWPRRTLVVVDYAAASAHILRAWLEALVRRPAGPAVPQLRVLLLERHAESDSGWWAELTRPGGSSGRDPRDLLDPAAPIPLRPLAGVGDRRALLTEAMAEAARVSGITPAPVPPPLGADPLFDQRLEENVIETQPLYLMMAGIVSVRTGAPAALALSRLELADKVANADEIAGSERNRLIRLARTANVSERLLLHAAACVTLEQGCDNDSLLTLVEQECAALGFAGDAAEDLAALLRDALGAPDGSGVEAVRPDLIGEAFLLRELGHSNRTPLRAETIVERAFRRAGPRVVITVIRTAQDHAQGDANHPSVGWLDHLAHLTDEPFVLMAIADELPEQTLALRERAAEITARIVELLAPRAEIDPELIPIRAGWLNTLALRLSDLGQREAALAAAQEAVELRRALAAQHPDRFQPDLAMSLNNLASRLGDLGQREAALVAVQEAAELYRALAAQRPDAFRPDLAMSLNNLAGRLSELGQREAALAAAQDAVELRRALAILRPDTFRRDLATSLNNLANMLSNLGQREAAVAAAREAVELYRALAAHQPDAFRPDLARSLSSLVRGLSELGQRDAALTAAREAEALYRTLADQRPDAFRPRLAASLIRLAIGLRELGQRQAALAAAAEAVDLYRALTAQRPDAFQPDLAISLNNLANVLSDLGQGEAALTAAQEAVEIHRGLVAQRPDAFRPDLAMSLNNLAQVLSKLGKREAAVAVVQEAVVLYRALAARQPDAFGPDLARSLMVLSQCLDQSDCPDDGIAANSEAIATLSPMFQRVPTAFAQLIGSMARDYLERCKKLDREPDEALLAPVVAVFQALRTEQGEQR